MIWASAILWMIGSFGRVSSSAVWLRISAHATVTDMGGEARAIRRRDMLTTALETSCDENGITRLERCALLDFLFA